ncbi:pachytene checkpoint-like protein [Chloropicon primus]|nr:pachytene checkpoint-like protein [Chloropicon primus]
MPCVALGKGKFTFSVMEKVPLHVEVRLKPESLGCTKSSLHEHVSLLLKSLQEIKTGVVNFGLAKDDYLDAHVERIFVCERERSDGEEDGDEGSRLPLLFWQVDLVVHEYQLSLDEPCEEVDGDEDIASFTEYYLPSVHFEGLWESLMFEEGGGVGGLGVKRQLMNYSRSALLFSALGVDHNVIAWNRLILLHGPPGTGKTSLCKALAHKLSVRHFSATFEKTSPEEQGDYPSGFRGEVNFSKLIEINAHSLFSKWFSESGKLVSKLFQQIRDLAELALDLDSGGQKSLVFVLIDEVESLAVARKQSIEGGEPSDGIRAVNALLTQLDQLRQYPNVYVMCTSNVSDAIDEAFLDRADLKIHLGNPSVSARYSILGQGLNEMRRVGLISDAGVRALEEVPKEVREEWGKGCDSDGGYTDEELLWKVCASLEDESGRQLRKLPFLCFSKCVRGTSCRLRDFLRSLLGMAATTASPRGERMQE